MKKSVLLRQFAVAAALVSGMIACAPGFFQAHAGIPGSSANTLPASVSSEPLVFRSFSPESLVTRKFEKRVPAATGWHATFLNTTGSTVSTLELHFRRAVTLTGFAPFPDAIPLDENRTWFVYGQKLAHGDSLTVYGIGPADRTEISSWRYDAGAFQPGFIPFGQEIYLPMPNSANLRLETFQFGGFAPGAVTSDPIGGMVVGKSFLRLSNGRWRLNPDSAAIYGWVRLRNQGVVLRSLQRSRRSPLHTGPPRGFVSFDNGRPFRRQSNGLTTLKMNNRLFAELVALKMNIGASTLGIIPAGFGELIYQDSGHPLDGTMIRDISAIADSFMTYSTGRDSSSYTMLDSVTHKINLAFCGPIDTVSFADSLVFTGARPLSEVSFLRLNPDVPALRLPRVYQQEFDDSSEDPDEEPPVPQAIMLTQNYPNPFNPQTVIQFELAEPGMATMKVYDLLGRELTTLMHDELAYEGTNEVVFDATGFSSGTYFYRLFIENFDNPDLKSEFTGKMVLIR